MYKINVPFKDLHDKPGNQTVYFNLFPKDVIKLMVQFKAIYEWYDKNQADDVRQLDSAEVVDFYNNFEDIVLASYGTPSSDGLRFSREDRYTFEDSVIFSAFMDMMVTDTDQVAKFLEGVMPKNMEEVVKKADDNVAKALQNTKDEDLHAELERLRRQLGESSDS